mmetsp:Transcript_38467/g.95521  ORF Transcript_38467/g.95521 Transcript_38467/m.95521 type:complete len:224 (+) Transcript_38467:302-973(+)
MAHCVGLSRGNHKVLCHRVLQHFPHALYIVARVAPVPLGVHVAQVQTLLLSRLDVGHGKGNFARHERLAAAGRLVVKQDAVARKHVVRLTVVHHCPVCHQFSHRVGRAGIERSLLILWDGLHFAIELGGGRLVELGGLGLAREANGLKDVQRSHAVHLGGVHWHLEGHLDVRLCGEVVHFGGPHVADDGNEGVEVGKVAVVQKEVLAVWVSLRHYVLQPWVVI